MKVEIIMFVNTVHTGQIGSCLFVYWFFLFCIDLIGDVIGCGTSSIVYKAVLKEKNSKMALKAFKSISDKELIRCDILVGFSEEIQSEYTITYEDCFNTGECQCVSMALMERSLDKFIIDLILSSPKKYLSDDVCHLFYFKFNIRKFFWMFHK